METGSQITRAFWEISLQAQPQISIIRYPAKHRDGVGLTFEGGAIGIGATAGANLIQEFLIRKLTRNVPNNDPPKP